MDIQRASPLGDPSHASADALLGGRTARTARRPMFLALSLTGRGRMDRGGLQRRVIVATKCGPSRFALCQSIKKGERLVTKVDSQSVV